MSVVKDWRFIEEVLQSARKGYEAHPQDPKARYDYLMALSTASMSEPLNREIADWQSSGQDLAFLEMFKAVTNRYAQQPSDQWSNGYELGFQTGHRTPTPPTEFKVWEANLQFGLENLIVWAEDGIGDFLRHLCHLPKLAGVKRTLIVAPAKLHSFLEASLGNCFEFWDIGLPLTGLDPDPNRTRIIPSGSLDGIFWHPQLNPQSSGYLQLALEEQAFGASFLPPTRGEHRVRVGLCYRSMRQGNLRNIHYTNPNDWMPVLDIEGLDLFSLQYDETEKDRALFDEIKLGAVHHFPELDFFDDILALAQVITQMDVVISVGTMVADLSSALGIKTLRCQAGNSATAPAKKVFNNAWYGPATQLYVRSPTASWAPVMDMVAEDLIELRRAISQTGS